MDCLTDKHRNTLKGLKHDRDDGIPDENKYAQGRARILKMARQEFDAQSVQRRVQPDALPLPGRYAIPARPLAPHSMHATVLV